MVAVKAWQRDCESSAYVTSENRKQRRMDASPSFFPSCILSQPIGQMMWSTFMVFSFWLNLAKKPPQKYPGLDHLGDSQGGDDVCISVCLISVCSVSTCTVLN